MTRTPGKISRPVLPSFCRRLASETIIDSNKFVAACPVTREACRGETRLPPIGPGLSIHTSVASCQSCERHVMLIPESRRVHKRPHSLLSTSVRSREYSRAKYSQVAKTAGVESASDLSPTISTLTRFGQQNRKPKRVPSMSKSIAAVSAVCV
jgi:hypothetical protein